MFDQKIQSERVLMASGENPKVKVDRINSMPDDVLSLILSFLPTKCAVGTSILSNRWKYLWTSITSLHFEAFPTASKMTDFTNFVDKVFRDCKSPHIQKFCLHFHSFWAVNSQVTATWINKAIKRNVSEMDIKVCKWPLSIFSCKTLTVLKLAAYEWYDEVGEYIPSFCLPCLKVLHIGGEKYTNDFMQKLIDSCPVLEDLTLGGFIGFGKGDIIMVAPPTLTTLRIQLKPRFRDLPTRDFFITAPNLMYLHLKEGSMTYNIVGNFPSLIKANVNNVSCFKGRRPPGFQLLKRISAIKSLAFTSTMRIRPGFTLPKFHNLTCLEVISCDYRFWSILPKFINSSPSLEFLSLEQLAPHNTGLQPEMTWVEPKSVPKCLHYHLVTIKIQGFKGRMHHLGFLKYCLGNAKVLQWLTINCRGLTQVEEMQFYEQLLKFARVSGNCQIHFHGDFVSNL